jgi:hypothetical protein
MELLKEFARTEKQFISWFWERYQQPPEIFDKAPFIHQCETIWRFLGYPVDAPVDWTITYSEEFTRNVLYLYEALLIKYPDGVKDALKELKEMSYTERKLKYPQLEEAANIMHSLNEAIIEVDKYHIKARPLPSLNDAIIMLKRMIMAPVVEDTFWETILPKNRKDEGPVPF